MPIKTSADPRERARIEQALERLRSSEPRLAKHRDRVRRGSLQTNLNTLSSESGVKRHRIEKLYPDLAEAANRERGERGEAVPLRKQLDAARRDKQAAERRLEQSNSYNFHLMERISQFRAEVHLLKDRVEEFEAGAYGDPDDLFMGTDDVIGVPPMPSKRRSRGRTASATA